VAHALVLYPDTIFASDFRIVRPLSEGGMGAVYLVEQISTGSPRALKVMHEHLVSDDKLRKRFVQEARVGSKIRSDHVVQVIAAGIDEASATPWLVMELLEGKDLAAYERSRGRLPMAEVREICAQFCHALAAAHQVGVVHRDLKPENVFLSEARREGAPFTLKVLDFGISKILSEAVPSTTTSAIGTPMWMAPEQTDPGAVIGPATDVWALGLMVYWMLTGRSYWRVAAMENVSAMALMREVVFEPLTAASARAAESGCADALPQGFDAWFARCVVRELPARFHDAGQARAALLPLLGMPVTGPTALPLELKAEEDHRAAVDVVTAPTQLATPVTGPALPTGPAVSESLPPPAAPSKRWMIWAGAGLLVACVAVAGLMASQRQGAGQGKLVERCQHGHAQSCAALAKAHETGGRGVTRSMDRAADYYFRACQSGDFQSCMAAGNLYQSGENVTRDDARAAACFDKACAGGEGLGCRNLGTLTLNGDGVTRSEARALWLFMQACDKGQPEACTKAAEMHRDGRGVNKDLEKAKELFSRACFGRDPKACKELESFGN
jgi:serine/threonine protein kinase/TPR repeat protein